MYVACSTLCLADEPLDQVFATFGELQFQKLELPISESSRHLRLGDVVQDVNRVAQRLRSSGFAFAAFYVSLPSEDAETNRSLIRNVCRLARVLSVPVVTIQAAPLGSDFDAEVRRLSCLVKLAAAEGVILTVETNRESVTADPVGAESLCRRIPGLGLTLDPSHYLMSPHGVDFDRLYPLVRHVRLRDTSTDRFQVRIGQGQIEYGRIISQLSNEGYTRALCIDIEPRPDIDFPVLPEVRKLKYLLESMI